MNKLTNKQFLNKLKNTKNYKELSEISNYESIDKPITFCYKGVKYKMTPYNLLKECEITFRSCIEKEKYLQKHLKEGKVLKVLGQFSYVKSSYGICKIPNKNIKKGVGPGLKNALNRHSYFLNYLNDVNVHYKKRRFRVLGFYKNYNKHILIKNKYGICKMTVGHLLQGKFPSIDSSINKDEYFKNLMIEIHGDIYEYKKITKESFRKFVEFKCSKHGWMKSTWKSFYINKTSCKLCTKENFVARGFTKEKYINVCKGRNSYLYLIKLYNKNEEFYKIGLTLRSLKERFYGLNYNVEVLLKVESSADKIFDAENELHKKYKKYKYTPKNKFNGYTECYNSSLPINDIITKYERL